MEPALPQTLFRMTDPRTLAEASGDRQPGDEAARRQELTDEQVVEELFLATLTRFPEPDEVDDVQRAPRRNEGPGGGDSRTCSGR